MFSLAQGKKMKANLANTLYNHTVNVKVMVHIWQMVDKEMNTSIFN